MIRVTQSLLSNAEAAVTADLDQYIQRLDYVEAASICLLDLGKGLTGTLADNLRSFYYGLWFLEHAAMHGVGTSKNMAAASAFCELVLRHCGILPVSSKFSHLYNRIYNVISQHTLIQGDPWLAMWQAGMGERLTGVDGDLERDHLAAGDLAFKMAKIQSAASSYFLAEGATNDQVRLSAARMGRVRCARLSGDSVKALELTIAAQNEFAKPRHTAIAFHWQERLCQVQQCGSIEPLFVAWDKTHDFYKAEYALTAALIAYTHKGGALIPQIRRLSTLRTYFMDDIVKGSRAWHLLKMLQAVEEFRDVKQKMEVRLKKLGAFFAEYKEHWDCEDRLIFAAAASRWLHSCKQTHFLKLMLEEITSLSLHLSDGVTTDCLGLSRDLVERTDALPASSAKRVLRFSSLAAQVGILVIKDKVSSSSDYKMAQDLSGEVLLTRLVRLMIEEVGQLRGPIMKAGQLIVALAPISGDLRAEMQQSLSSTLHMPSSVFEDVFTAAFGKHPAQYFRRWQTAPIGVGSTGQVFKAELQDGSVVAVKITYPKLAKMIHGDIKILRMLHPLLRVLFPGIDITTVMDIIQNLCLSECNLRLEAANHEKIYRHFSGREGIIIPKLYPEFTTAQTIVTEFIDGLRMFEFAPQANPEQIKHVYDTIISTYIESLTELNLVQFDPHAGNYLYCDGKIAFLDFGNRYLAPPRLAIYVDTCWRLIYNQDREGLAAYLISIGSIDNKRIAPDVIYAYADFAIERYRCRYISHKPSLAPVMQAYMKASPKDAISPDPHLMVVMLTLNMLNTIFSAITTHSTDAAAFSNEVTPETKAS